MVNKKKYNIYYHGTPSSNLPSIRKVGLLTDPPKTFESSHGWKTKGRLSLSDNYDDAFYYASLFTSQKNEPITILRVKVPISKKLKRGVAYTEKISDEDIDPKYLTTISSDNKVISLKNLKSNKNHINLFRLKRIANRLVAEESYLKTQNRFSENKFRRGIINELRRKKRNKIKIANKEYFRYTTHNEKKDAEQIKRGAKYYKFKCEIVKKVNKSGKMSYSTYLNL